MGATTVAARAEPAGVWDDLTAAAGLMQAKDCGAALTRLDVGIAKREFGSLRPRLQMAAYNTGVFCAGERNNLPLAYRYALAGTRLKGAQEPLWRTRLGIEVQDKRLPAAVDTVEAMAADNGEALNAMPIAWLTSLSRDLKAGGDAKARRRLLAVLSKPAYRPDELMVTSDRFLRDRAVILLADGDRAGAAALVARFEDPSFKIGALFDSRLRDLAPAPLDVRAAVERRLVEMREVSASHQGSMAAVLAVTHLLRMLGRYDEALATLQASRPDGPGKAAFTDLDEYADWWWDAVGHTHARLGHYDEAVRAYRAAIAAHKADDPALSQVLNLAEVQARFGHPADALATVAPLGAGKVNASEYGQMVLQVVRGCAKAALQGAGGAREELAYAVAHEKDSPGGLTDILLCTGDLSGAAASTVRRLDDADQRAAALLWLSDFDPGPPGSPPADLDLPFLPALKARPDVQAAIARAGGVRRLPLQQGEVS